MNADKILQTMNQFGVDYLLMGGMNFMLRHEPILTFDVDIRRYKKPVGSRNCNPA